MACVELPAFPLQLLLAQHPAWRDRPVAVVDRDAPQGVIRWVNQRAADAGIRAGMRYGAGLSLARTLHAAEVPPDILARARADVTERLRQFSPGVDPGGSGWGGGAGGAAPGGHGGRPRPVQPRGREVGRHPRTGLRAQAALLGGPAAAERGIQGPPRSGREGLGAKPHLVMDVPGVWWLDVSGLSHLYASPRRWAEAVHQALRRAGYHASVVVGFTRFGTYAIARILGAGRSVAVLRDRSEERARVGEVPVDRLGIEPAVRDRLHQLGVRTVGELLALPAASIRRRFGPRAERWYRLAAGELWAPLQPLPVEEALEQHLALDDPERDLARLLFVVKRVLDRVLAAAGARQERLVEVTLELRDERGGRVTEQIRAAAPTVEPGQWMGLIRLRLEAVAGRSRGPAGRPSWPAGGGAPGATALVVGVTDVHLSARAIRPQVLQPGLFVEQPRRDLAAANRALARLRAELGDDAVVRAYPVQAHLPEARFRWEPLETLTAPAPRDVACRPLVRRLHPRPVRLPGRLGAWLGAKSGEVARTLARTSARDGDAGERLIGPYVVSGGWWRSTVHREYYFARTHDGVLLWVFYDRPRRRWWWHGQVE